MFTRSEDQDVRGFVSMTITQPFRWRCFLLDIVPKEMVTYLWLDGGHDKPLRPADILLYSWNEGLDVCVDLTGSSPLTQTKMVDFVPGRAVIIAAQRKRGKYMDMCVAIGYGFLPFYFSSLGELVADAITLLKRIRKFSITQDIGARADIHIFNRMSFTIAKGVGAQIVSRLPSNFCSSRALRMFIEQSHDEVYGCLKGGSGNSRGQRLAISMVEEAWLSEKKEV
ncbi:hypothetical protein Tco_0530205 [Tanacetum coccineum]